MNPTPAAAGARVRQLGAFAAALLLVTGLLIAVARPAAAQELGTCAVTFRSTVSAQGFVHPGVGLTEPILENARRQIAAGAEPWTSSLQAMRRSSAAGTGVTSSNRSSADPTKPASDAFNSQGFNGRFIADGLKSYTQAILYVLTGEEVYRKNALDIIRIWEQMDPAKYEYFTDSHIHTGIPLNRMVSAAELLRYTSCADEGYPWTDADTRAFTDNLVVPVIKTFQNDNNYFMNQHSYPLMGAMAGAIFMDDTALYKRSVEWFTVNATAKDQGFNGSIARLFRWVDTNDATGKPIKNPHVQHAEMGRDQAHGGGDLTNAAIISRMLLAQGTKVDPVAGTVSDAPNAVGPYEFLDNRILAAADYFWRYMLGYDTPWTPMAYAISPDGTIRDTYNHISYGYRGRYNTASFWDIYYYYAFTRGEDVKKLAPYFAEAYAKRNGPLFYYGGGLNNAWDNVDGGGDSWLFAPASAAGQTVPPLPASPTILEVENKYTRLSGDVEQRTDGDTGYVRMSTAGHGSEIAYLSGSSKKQLLAFRIRTDGEVRLRLDRHDDRTILVPNTGGEWRYVMYPHSIGDILFIQATGNGTIDIDHINTNAAAELTPPTFDDTSTARIVDWKGATATADLSAHYTGTDSLAYTAQGLPTGATLDASTGQLTWTPAAAGSTVITVTVSDGTTVASHHVVLAAAHNRFEALTLAQQGHDADAEYVSDTRTAYDQALTTAEALRTKGTDDEYLAALAHLVTAVDGLTLVSPHTAVDGSLDYPSLVVASTAGANIGNLVDGDNQSGTVYSQAVNLSHTFDFGPDFRVSATRFGFQSNIFADRLANSTVYGSNDGKNWTRLTPGVTQFTQDFNTLAVDPAQREAQFRYLKVQMLKPLPDVLYGIVRNVFEMTEFHIYGERHEIGNLVKATSIASPQAIAGKIMTGDTVDVSVTAKKPIQQVTVTVQGVTAKANSADGVNWTASVELDNVPPGDIQVAVDYLDANGKAGPTAYGTTDGSKLYIAGDPTHFVDVAKLATVTASDKQWPGSGLGADEVGYLLFDRDPDTYGDLNSGAGAYYVIDFGAHATVRPEEVLILPRTSHPQRANGTVVQGSNDAQTWTDLTKPLTGAAANAWSDQPTSGGDHYRYLRIYNATSWYGNLSEVELYGDIKHDA
ncbi:putative Ig domain-containing protein [Streptomyces cynarae]|uniref:Ig domain-containing protein n=1 Tax=Streptomyces cynarae TaxID=2981134 RepID=A0ABY6EE90_9ACTN|nr:putative Ig domain-containing protein [Streptomyces cynarae]UXY24203.1 putative Ig domain-containing protein [Streptomyces cynarae]